MDQKNNQSDKAIRRGEFVGTIAQISSFSHDLKSLTLELSDRAAECFAQAKAGQFVQLACRDLENSRCPTPLLRRPFSIAQITTDKQRVRLEIIYRILGPGTNWLSRRTTGETIDLLGPLGNGFTLPNENNRKAILLGGGVGLPPMFFLADQLTKAGHKQITALAGARSKDQFIGSLCLESYNPSKPLIPQPVIEQLNRSGTNCIFATDDGSVGYHGLIVDALDQYLAAQEDPSGIDLYACGPDGMLRAISVLAEKFDLPCQICMEAYMACGIGLCQSCVVQVKSQTEKETKPNYKLVCTNGPVFDSRSIIWE
jgi:dihydroorotate dehydrogenase electron transfer subunit